MGRRRDGIRSVLDLENDGFEQEKVTEDLVGVLAETLVERVEFVTQGRIERLVCIDEGEQDRPCRRVRRHRQRLDRECPNPGEYRLPGGDVGSEALGQLGAGIVVSEVLK